jgi:DNA-nicking Smr family endonuclease
MNLNGADFRVLSRAGQEHILRGLRVTKRKTRDDDEDDEVFARAMAAARVVPFPRGVRERAAPRAPVALPPLTASPAGVDNADPASGPDVDFAADGVDRREIRRLKRGDYRPAVHCDLHGLTANAARAQVQQVLAASRREQHRCVCIVHGRGVRSPGGVAVLKARVRELLKSHPAVLAFADAPPSDGGSGAVYVLLRRR